MSEFCVFTQLSYQPAPSFDCQVMRWRSHGTGSLLSVSKSKVCGNWQPFQKFGPSAVGFCSFGTLHSMHENSHLQSLLTRAKAGDAAALNKLLAHYRPELQAGVQLRVAVRRRSDASDVVQLALLAIAKDFPDFRGTSLAEFESWLKTLVQRSLLQTVRRETAQRRDARQEQPLVPTDASTHTPPFPAEQTSPSAQAARNEAWESLQQPLGRLPPRQQAALRLRFEFNKSLEEIATELECTQIAAAGLLRRGLAALRATTENGRKGEA
jgi:RNA polymerase sigma-70 factor (subfamily 1)